MSRAEFGHAPPNNCCFDERKLTAVSSIYCNTCQTNV